ncbi:MAG: hypothetical protein JSS09_03090 [Verrucomicrobia bacterium]|nr:hypothetical protein [Verrucomicrobiota bacterium]
MLPPPENSLNSCLYSKELRAKPKRLDLTIYRTNYNELTSMKINILFFTTLALLSSCTTKLALSYDPVIEQKVPNHIEVAVEPFEDARKDIHLVGVKRNGYGMPIIKILTDDNVVSWMTGALKEELSNAGFSTVNKRNPSAYEVKGTILQVWTSTYFIYHGKMQVRISVCKNNLNVFDKVYLFKKSGGFNWAATNKSCSKTLEINLQELCKQFIKDFTTRLSLEDETPKTDFTI